MDANHTGLEFEVLNTGETIRLTAFASYVAGYTGRDPEAVQKHIDELAEIGVAPPPQVPMFYPVDPSTVTTTAVVQVAGDQTSGEVEPLYVRHRGRYYIGVASDHTDREVEVEDIGKSKQVCPKPVATQIVEVGGLEGLSLDDATVRSFVDDQLYQEGQLDGLRTPADVVTRLLETHDLGDQDFICLGGTLPLRTGSFVYGQTWKLELEINGQKINHLYSVEKENNE